MLLIFVMNYIISYKITINFDLVDCFCNAMVRLLISFLSTKWCSFCLWERDFMFSSVGLKFDKVSPRADHTNIVVITIVPVETLIGVSPVVQLYTTVLSPYTFGLVGVAPLTLLYTFCIAPVHSRRLPLHFLYASLTLSVHLL